MKKRLSVAGILLIAVSVLLACVLVVQCLFWAGTFKPAQRTQPTLPSEAVVGSLSREGYTVSLKVCNSPVCRQMKTQSVFRSDWVYNCYG